MIPNLLVAGLLLGHALIHGAYIAPRPPATAAGPAWPFDLGNSWLLGRLGLDPAARMLGIVLVAVTIAGFALGAVVALGVLPGALWQPAIGIGAAASLGVLVIYFHPWLVLGVAIDLVLLWAVLVAGWSPAGLAA